MYSYIDIFGVKLRVFNEITTLIKLITHFIQIRSTYRFIGIRVCVSMLPISPLLSRIYDLLLHC